MKQIAGQISIFDFLKKTKKIQTNNCYQCLFRESYRCRNYNNCPEGMHFEKYTGSHVRQCIYATTEIYQDGYIQCPVINSMGCEKCMELFGDGEKFVYDESQNYECFPRKLLQI